MLRKPYRIRRQRVVSGKLWPEMVTIESRRSWWSRSAADREAAYIRACGDEAEVVDIRKAVL